MIADKEGNLYLVTANNSVYKISINSKLASYVGRIKGLPRGYSTNGAVSEGNSKVVVSSAQSTEGYFRFDLGTLKAEKISSGAAVFNASDLANSLFAYEKTETEEKPKDVATTDPVVEKKAPVVARNTIAVYPNPVTTGLFKVSFADQLPGRYHVQLLDVDGKIISTRPVNVSSNVQVEEFRLPQQIAAGNYLVRVVNEATKSVATNQLVVQQ
jgi:hypothetical protein